MWIMHAKLSNAFCNITTDLQAIISDIDRYDRKRVLMSNWSNPSGNTYRLSNTGYIENLYKAFILNTVYLIVAVSLFYYSFNQARKKGTLINIGE